LKGVEEKAHEPMDLTGIDLLECSTKAEEMHRHQVDSVPTDLLER
jgi:hypothetical protein